MSYYRQGPHRPSGMGIGVPQLTPFVKMIIIACVAVWLVQFVGDRRGLISAWLGLVPAYVAGQNPWSLPFLWQPVSYMFLHGAGVTHILFNMLILWLFGSELEGRWGSRAFLTYYLVCGVGAGILAVLMALLLPWGNPWTVTIGASGAVYGLLIAYGMVFAQRTVLFMMIFPMKARTFAWILFAIAFISTWDSALAEFGQAGEMVGRRPDPVSHVAHLGGALTGFLYLKRAWRFGEFYRELRWKWLRRKFKIMPPKDPKDPWVH